MLPADKKEFYWLELTQREHMNLVESLRTAQAVAERGVRTEKVSFLSRVIEKLRDEHRFHLREDLTLARIHDTITSL